MGLVGERPESFRVVDGEHLVFGTIVAQARAQTDLNGGIDVLDLLVSFLGGVDAELAFGFAFVDELFSEVHDHEVRRRDFDPFGFGVCQQRLRSPRDTIGINGQQH